ncbi:ribonuclease H-like domain-containing protein [Favolaschia claudopus]|uniref:Ribonuclease H-like domain-containing protein n=1 Tax=Favolaschia claudopus TaxID=2862362 RepID=A0AAW0CHP8_9AGAR
MNTQPQRFAPDDAATKMKLGNPKSESLKAYEQQQTIILIGDVDEANNHLRSIGSNSVIGFDSEFKQSVKDKRGKVCTVQLTTDDNTYVVDMTRFDGCPAELRRILEDPTIVKAGTGLHCDGKIISECFSIDVKNCQDLGCMIRIAFPIHYQDTTSPLSLQQMVADVLHRDLKKDNRMADWELGLRDDREGRPLDSMLLYAALDAQAGLELHYQLVAAIAMTAQQRKVDIPIDWYTYDCYKGKAARMETDIHNKIVFWSWALCPWYVGGKFSNFWK